MRCWVASPPAKSVKQRRVCSPQGAQEQQIKCLVAPGLQALLDVRLHSAQTGPILEYWAEP